VRGEASADPDPPAAAGE